jgi:hypothetical protein
MISSAWGFRICHWEFFSHSDLGISDFVSTRPPSFIKLIRYLRK